jgi:adenylosuccinate synthase
MPVTAIVGAQWGDEGKGKITDLLAQEADLVIRYGGGSNAGHTVINDFGEFKLHLVPSGIFNPDAVSLVGTGTVVDLDFLGPELEHIRAAGVPTEGLRISSRAHLTMPYHLLLDQLGDEARDSFVIGTTRRGVGPTYVDKADRVGVQTGDLLDPQLFRRKLELVLPEKNRQLKELYGVEPLSLEQLLAHGQGWRETYGSLIVDQVELVHDSLQRGDNILLEGQLGALRDLDWGTYPYVTSSTTVAGGGAVGGGVPPMCITNVVGVVKAYTSAVGEGPLPAELTDATGDRLRDRGAEYGATTGRPRRIGWFDAVATRYAHLLNHFTGMAVTKLDVLDGEPILRICTAYRVGEKRYHTVPGTAELERAVPEYEEIEGWEGSCSGARSWNDLPAGATRYLSRLEELVGAPITHVSVGPAREQTILEAGIR